LKTKYFKINNQNNYGTGEYYGAVKKKDLRW